MRYARETDANGCPADVLRMSGDIRSETPALLNFEWLLPDRWRLEPPTPQAPIVTPTLPRRSRRPWRRERGGKPGREGGVRLPGPSTERFRGLQIDPLEVEKSPKSRCLEEVQKNLGLVHDALGDHQDQVDLPPFGVDEADWIK